MDAKQIEQLLYEEESTTLDFKREQYPFRKEKTMTPMTMTSISH